MPACRHRVVVSAGDMARTSARQVRRLFGERRGGSIRQVDPYTWATPEAQPEDAEDWFGTVDPESARPYESARSYSRVAQLLRGRLAKPAPGRVTTCR